MTVKAVPTRDLVGHLTSKGFREDSDDRDHHYFFLWLAGKKQMLRVKLSRGAKEIAREEIRRNAYSFGLTGDDLYKILSCEHDALTTAQVWRASSKYKP